MSSSIFALRKMLSSIRSILLPLRRTPVILLWSSNTCHGRVPILFPLRSKSASRLRLLKLEPCSVAMVLFLRSRRMSSNNFPKACCGISVMRLCSRCKCLSFPRPCHWLLRSVVMRFPDRSKLVTFGVVSNSRSCTSLSRLFCSSM